MLFGRMIENTVVSAKPPAEGTQFINKTFSVAPVILASSNVGYGAERRQRTRLSIFCPYW